jgi:hypothetical protein
MCAGATLDQADSAHYLLVAEPVWHVLIAGIAAVDLVLGAALLERDAATLVTNGDRVTVLAVEAEVGDFAPLRPIVLPSLSIMILMFDGAGKAIGSDIAGDAASATRAAAAIRTFRIFYRPGPFYPATELLAIARHVFVSGGGLDRQASGSLSIALLRRSTISPDGRSAGALLMRRRGPSA